MELTLYCLACFVPTLRLNCYPYGVAWSCSSGMGFYWLPKNFNSSTFQMEIGLTFAKKPKRFFMDRFKLNEILFKTPGESAYQDTKVYIHKVSDYPFDVNFEVPFCSDCFNDYIVEKLEEHTNEIDSDVNTVNCALKELFQKYSNTPCLEEGVVLMQGNQSNSLETLNSISENSRIQITVEMKPKVKLQTESLIMEINTLLSQMGGSCAFFTGLTFTFIGEVIEIIIIWIMDKRSLR